MSTLVAALPYIIITLFLASVAIVAAAVYSSQRGDEWIFSGDDIDEITCGPHRFSGDDLLSVGTPSRKSPLWRMHFKDGRQLLTSEHAYLRLKPLDREEEPPNENR
jgi:hypothetical protein